MKDSRRLLRLLSVATVVLIALALRLRAVDKLPIDNDEDDYLRAAQQFAALINAQNWAGFTRTNYRAEHPPLAKITYGAALSGLPQAPEIPDQPTASPPPATLPQPHLTVTRLVAAGLGTLEVLLLALLDPLAGLFLAVHTFVVKYTSQAMLEAQPSFTSLIAVLAYRRSKRRWNGWAALSAVALGLTAAAKYAYAIVGAATVAHWLWVAWREPPPRHARLAPPIAWALLALTVFFAADPYLWPDPVGRFKDSLLYHGQYAWSEAVRCHGQPFWQPLGWLKKPISWNPGVFVISIDPFISILALLGLPRLWRVRRVFALWGILTLGFLLAWPTKWPHYVLLLAVPLSVAAAEGTRTLVWNPLIKRWHRGMMQGFPL